MVTSEGQPVFQSDMAVRYAEPSADRAKLFLGLQYIGTERFETTPKSGQGAALPERRRYPRSVCEIPGTMIVTGPDAENTLPVVISDLSEAGCRVEGPENLDHLVPGTVCQVCLEPWESAPIRALAEVVAVHSPRVLGLVFETGVEGAADSALQALVMSLRYPDLVVGQSGDAEQLWETISASGYFRERAPGTYMKLHEHAVHCWDRLNSPVSASINRTLLSPGPDGRILSLCQISRFYTDTWMAHHLAVLNDTPERSRLARQQFGSVFDSLHDVGARWFINYHNAAHKAQRRIWVPFVQRVSGRDVSLRELLCYDMVTARPRLAMHSDRVLHVRQQGASAANRLLPLLRRHHPALVYEAMGFEDDLELERLDLAYARVGLQRRRCWLTAESPEGDLLGAASIEEAPTGFNLTSVGDQMRLYLGADVLDDPGTCVVVRRLLHHATDYFRRLDKPYFMLLTDMESEPLIGRSLGLTPMARAHELVMSASVFAAARDFVGALYAGLDATSHAPGATSESRASKASKRE